MNTLGKPGLKKSTLFLPALVTAVVAALAVAGWKTLDAHDNDQIRAKIAIITESVRGQLQQTLTDRGHALAHMSTRWEYRGGLAKSEWESDARQYIAHYTGFQAIEWIDPELYVRWIEPLAGNEPALNADLGFEKNRRLTFERARDRHEIVISPPISLIQGGRGFLAAVPIYRQNQSDGFILGVFRMQEFFNATLANVAKRYAVSISYDGQEVYHRDGAVRMTTAKWNQTTAVQIFGQKYEICVWPLPAELAQMQTRADNAVLVGGLLLAFFLGLAIWLAQHARYQTRQTEQSYQALRENETRLTAVLTATKSGILLVDPHGRILTTNPRFAELWRIPESLLQTGDDEALLRYVTEQLVAPDEFLQEVQRLYRSDEAGLSIIQFKDGRFFERFTNVVKCEGQRIGRLWSFRDITERRQMEITIQQAHRQTELLLHAVGEGIYGLDLVGQTTFVNPAAARMLGYEPAEIIGQPQHELIHHHRPDGTSYPQTECPIYAAFKDGQVHHVDTEVFWRKDGSSFPVDYTSTPVRDEAGKLCGAVVVFSDITVRKQAELQLRASEFHTRHLNEVLQAINEINQLVNQKNDWQELLNTACQILTKTRGYISAWVGVPESGPRKLIVPVARAGVAEDFFKDFIITWDDSPTGQGTTGTAVRERRADVIEDIATDPRFAPWRDPVLQVGAAAIASVPIIYHTRIFGVLTVKASRKTVFDRDEISILQSLATQLAQRLQSIDDEAVRQRAVQALEKSLHEKEALLKEVHHRVKNNMQIVTSLLNLQVRQTVNPVVVAALRDTQNRIRSMALLHENLYQLGNLAEANFATYVKNLCAHLTRVYDVAGRRIELQVEVDDMALDLESAIPCGLIITELVSNAIKHAFPDERTGKIVIAIHYDSEGRLVLQVTDNGIGFTPKPAAAKSDSLGIQLVQSLTEQLNGRLEYETGTGTSIRVILSNRKGPVLKST